MNGEISTEEMLRLHQRTWRHERPFKDDKDSGGLALRTYRAINWTHRAREEPDHFAAFLFFWIAFNSLYDAGDRDRSEPARRRFSDQLADCDGSDAILEALGVFSFRIRRVIDDDRAYGSDSSGISLKSKSPTFVNFEEKRLARQTANALEVAFDPLNRIRNWLMHGGISWGSRRMGETVRNGSAVLTGLVPAFIQVMLAAPNRSQWSFPLQTPDQYEEPTSPRDFVDYSLVERRDDAAGLTLSTAVTGTAIMLGSRDVLTRPAVPAESRSAVPGWRNR